MKIPVDDLTPVVDRELPVRRHRMAGRRAPVGASVRPAPYEIKVRFGLTKRVGVSRVKRAAIRRCREMTRRFGAGASGEVRRKGLGHVYRCYADVEGGRVVVREDLP
jgi:hypothetical protein